MLTMQLVRAKRVNCCRPGTTLLLLGALLAGLVAPVRAEDNAQPLPRVVDLSSGSGSFAGEGPLLSAGTELITFNNLPPGTYSYKLTLSGEGIDGLAASVNGQTAGTFTVGQRSFAGLEGRDTGSFTVQISGRPGNGASYQGEVTITPEAERMSFTPALLAGGLLAAVGAGAWRRLRRR